MSGSSLVCNECALVVGTHRVEVAPMFSDPLVKFAAGLSEVYLIAVLAGDAVDSDARWAPRSCRTVFSNYCVAQSVGGFVNEKTLKSQK